MQIIKRRPIDPQQGSQALQKGTSNKDLLINQVAERTGLSPDQAREAVQTAVSFLKAKLPAPIAS